MTQGAGSSASWRITAADAFSRIVAAPLVPGNSVRLLKDAAENYPAWLEAIEGAGRCELRFQLHHVQGLLRLACGAGPAARRTEFIAEIEQLSGSDPTFERMQVELDRPARSAPAPDTLLAQ